MLDATIPGTCLLPEIISPPGAGHDGSPRVGRRAIRLLKPPVPGQLPGTLIHAPLVPADRELMPEVRAALVDAHAIVIVVGYRDVIVDPQGSRAREAEARVRGWLPIAAQIAAPELLTVVVEGVEESNSNLDSRLAWTRRNAREALKLPSDWPYNGIVEMSSHVVLKEAEAERTSKAPTGQEALAWDSYGVTELLGRTLGPYELDPARWLTESALRRARAVFKWAAHELGDRLAGRPRDGAVDPDQVLLPRYARQRQSWLVALGLGDWLAAAGPEIDAALRDLADA
jgi:hypothetical protein